MSLDPAIFFFLIGFLSLPLLFLLTGQFKTKKQLKQLKRNRKGKNTTYSQKLPFEYTGQERLLALFTGFAVLVLCITALILLALGKRQAGSLFIIIIPVVPILLMKYGDSR